MVLFLAPVVFLWLLLWHSWFGPDIWYHFTWGRSLVETHSLIPQTLTLLPQPIYANGYWFFQLMMTGLNNAGGIYAISIFFLLMWTAIAWLWWRLVRASGFWGALLFLAFIVIAQLRFEARPEVFSYLFLAFEVWWLTQLDARRPLRVVSLLPLLVVQALWTNCHGYFVLGPLVAGAKLVAVVLEPEGLRLSTLRRILLVCAVVAAGCFVTPFPLGNFEAVTAYLALGQALRDWNSELMSPPTWPLYWPLLVFWSLWLVTIVWGVSILVRRQNIFAGLLSLAGAVLAARASRNMPLFLLLSAPAWRDLLPQVPLAPRWAKFAPSLAALAGCVFVITGAYHKSVMSLGTFGVHLEESAYPLAATQYLADHGFVGKLFCDSYDGGYVEYHLGDVRVAGDSYFSDPELTLEYFAAIRDPAALKMMDDRFHFDGLLINIENQAEVDALWDDPKWKLVYADLHRLVFLPNGTRVDFSKTDFYHGEDLSHWTYRFGAVTWAAIAVRHQDVALMEKLLHDFKKSKDMPPEVLRAAEIMRIF